MTVASPVMSQIPHSATITLFGEYPPRQGGIASHVATLRSRLLLEGVRTIVWDSREIGRFITLQGEEVQGSRLRALVCGPTPYPRPRLMHVHASTFRRLAVAGLALRVRFGINTPFLLTVHHGNLAAEFAGWPAHRRLACRTFIRSMAHVISVNPGIDEFLRDECHLLDTQRSVVPAYVGLTSSTLGVLDPSVLDYVASQRQAGRPIALAVCYDGRPAYGLHSLQPLIEDHDLRVSWVIVAYGGTSVYLDHLRDALQSRQHVLWLAGMDQSRFLALLSAVDVLVRPTTEDGDSLSVREALSLGTPVVASDVVQRPLGVTCVRTGEIHAWRNSILSALGRRSGLMTSASADDNFLSICGIYGRLLWSA